MKLSTLTFVSTTLLFSLSSAQSSVKLEPNFKEETHKNIAFFAGFGGASHYNWVLSISDELGLRGHNVTFITSDDDVRFGRPYTNVKTVASGSLYVFEQSIITGAGKLRSAYPTKFMTRVFGFKTANYKNEYLFAKQYFSENNIDVALCDHFSDPCIDAAKTLNIPFIVTSTLDLTDESSAPYINNKFTTLYDPTTEFQPFLERFQNKFINPLRDLYYIFPFAKKFNNMKVELGVPAKLEDPATSWKDSLKLINALNGYIAPRPVGPLAEYVGPIIPTHYKPLNEELKSYLDSHERVAYVAFGQKATPSEDEIKLILTSLIENVESGTLDGIMWATVNAAGFFPDTITTSSGKIYKTQDLFNGLYPDIRVVKWAPQTAVLLHPSTITFISHGGIGSWYESMYSGTRMIMFPFFGDQPGNALTIERSKLGGILRLDYTVEEATALVKKIVEDKDGEIMKSVKRFQAMTQIHSKYGVMRGADLVEEVAYTHVDGKLPHRESADRRMSYIKSHNLDLYAALVVLVVSLLYSISTVSKKVVSVVKRDSSQKIKNL